MTTREDEMVGLIARLRADDLWQQDELDVLEPICREAADAITALSSERDLLVEALSEIKRICNSPDELDGVTICEIIVATGVTGG